jgi:2-polyprenyl-3-methyl-5-hydroxy-6-metoxy-1,4-benzoquinol methylase
VGTTAVDQSSDQSPTGVRDALDMAAVQEFMARVVDDLSGAMVSIMCVLGHRLGLFRDLVTLGPATSMELATKSGLSERYVREWLHCLASAGYLEVDRSEGRFVLPPGLAFAVAVDGSPFNMAGGYQLVLALTNAFGAVAEAFRTGKGVPRDRYPAELYEATEEMSASWLDTLLVHQWLPAIDGLVARLQQGGRVADIGCGQGRALIICAKAFPRCELVGYDSFGPNIERARAAAQDARVAARVRFIQADAAAELTMHYDLVTAFDVLHDAADPAGMLRRIRAAIEPDGVLLLLESNSADDPLDNVGPAAAILYATSVLYCLPTSLADGGPGLGTMGLPPAKIRELSDEAGFRSVRPLPNANPFNALYEIRP